MRSGIHADFGILEKDQTLCGLTGIEVMRSVGGKKIFFAVQGMLRIGEYEVSIAIT